MRFTLLGDRGNKKALARARASKRLDGLVQLMRKRRSLLVQKRIIRMDAIVERPYIAGEVTMTARPASRTSHRISTTSGLSR
jgi:hypothetical protein